MVKEDTLALLFFWILLFYCIHLFQFVDIDVFLKKCILVHFIHIWLMQMHLILSKCYSSYIFAKKIFLFTVFFSYLNLIKLCQYWFKTIDFLNYKYFLSIFYQKLLILMYNTFRIGQKKEDGV